MSTTYVINQVYQSSSSNASQHFDSAKPQRLQLPSATAWHNGSCGGSFMMPPPSPHPYIAFPCWVYIDPFRRVLARKNMHVECAETDTVWRMLFSNSSLRQQSLFTASMCETGLAGQAHIGRATACASPPAGKRQPEELRWPTTSSLALV